MAEGSGPSAIFHLSLFILPRQRMRLDAFGCDLHWLDQPLLIKLHSLDADDAVIRPSPPCRPAMIDDVPLIFPRHLQHRVMAGAGRDRRILHQNFPDSLEWAQD